MQVVGRVLLDFVIAQGTVVLAALTIMPTFASVELRGQVAKALTGIGRSMSKYSSKVGTRVCVCVCAFVCVCAHGPKLHTIPIGLHPRRSVCVRVWLGGHLRVRVCVCHAPQLLKPEGPYCRYVCVH